MLIKTPGWFLMFPDLWKREYSAELEHKALSQPLLGE